MNRAPLEDDTTNLLFQQPEKVAWISPRQDGDIPMRDIVLTLMRSLEY